MIVNKANDGKNSNLTGPMRKFVHWSKEKISSSIASCENAVWILRHGENILQVNRASIEGIRHKLKV